MQLGTPHTVLPGPYLGTLLIARDFRTRHVRDERGRMAAALVEIDYEVVAIPMPSIDHSRRLPLLQALLKQQLAMRKQPPRARKTKKHTRRRS